MSGDLIPDNQAEAVAVLTKTQEAARLLEHWERQVDGSGNNVTLRQKIPQADRVKLGERQIALSRQLVSIAGSPDGRGEARDAILAMFAKGWPLYKFNDDPKKVAAAYVNALIEFPAWAIKSVCQSCATGKVEGLRTDFPPSGATLHSLCSELLVEIRAERGRYLRLLSIKDIEPLRTEETQEQRDATIARYEEWKKGHGITDAAPEDADRVKRREEADARRADFQRRQLEGAWGQRGLMPLSAPGIGLISPDLVANIKRGQGETAKALAALKSKLGDGQQT